MKSRTVCQVRLTAAHLVAWVATVAAALLGATTLGADPPVKGLIRTIPTSSEPSVSPGVDVALRVYGHGGTAPFEYSWRRNGAIIEDAEVSGDQLKLGPVELTDAGEYTVLVKHAEGEVLSNPFTLDVDPRFRRMPLPELGEACFGAWGDLDGDGWPDLVTTHADHVKVHINARDGTLPLKQSLACGSNPANFVTIGDFDNDGWPALVVTAINNWPLRIFRKAGAGNLVSQLSAPLAGR